MAKAPHCKSSTLYVMFALMMVVCFLGACKPTQEVVDISTMTAAERAEIIGLNIPQDSIKVTINNRSTQVKFSVEDTYGRPVAGIETLIAADDRFVRFTMAKLVAGANGNPDTWLSYVKDEGVPTYDSPREGGTLTANKDNSYTYTFAYNVGADAAFTRTVTHRLGGQLGNSTEGLEAVNVSYDFLPSGASVTARRDIIMTSSCNECHGKLVVHGRRFEMGYCVTCHNPDLVEGDDSFDMVVMTHKIHAANPDYMDGDFAEVTYPQDLTNCRKCHDGADEATPQGDNWKNKPSIAACGSCHSDVNFATGAGHTGGPATSNAGCAGCHPAASIETYHITANPTPNNPNLPTGVPNIAYSITDATVDGAGVPTINFAITADGTGLDVANLPAGYSGAPSFVVAWAQPQDGVDEPADFNNLGLKAGQPPTVSIADLVAGTAGSVACTGGACTATLNQTFPAGATMRTVALQGYYSITVGADQYALHTPSVVKTVTGDTERRTVVDSAKCANCHEWFEGHGGNRVYNMQVCVLCHNPNLSSSGREITAPNADIIAQLGPDSLAYPEATQNMKDMIHGIHASAVRTVDYEHVRNRTNGLYYNWSEVTFPTNVGNCLVCHVEDTYLLPLPENQLVTTNRTTGVADGQDASQADVTTARQSVPNATDWVITPVTASCYSCHTGIEAVAHMVGNGGSIDENRNTVLAGGKVETCLVCHGSGNDHDVKTSHPVVE